MKHGKKLLSVLLALVMTIVLAIPAYAAQEGPTPELPTGTITIQNAHPNQTYSIYQILYLESYNATSGAYSYKANSVWKSWVEDTNGGGKYLTTDSQGYVTWKKDASVEAFVKDALAHAQTEGSGITNDGQMTAGEATAPATTTTVMFSNVKPGYYLIDTTTGSLCSVTTTDPNATVEDKNKVPPVKKQVQEDSDSSWGDSDTAQIGDTVNFQTTITAYKGAQNYVLHDQMSDGLTLNATEIKDNDSETVIGVDGIKITQSDVDPDYNALKYGEDYTINLSPTDNCDFEIIFTQDYLDSITENTNLVVTYSATLNNKAVIFDEKNTEKNTNKTQLQYGDNNRTEWSETTTETFKFQVVKTDDKNKLIDGAEFQLYTQKTGGTPLVLVDNSDGTYRVATSEDTDTTTTIVVKDGQAVVEGLDSDSATKYYLEETKAPAGYNKLEGRTEITMNKGNLLAQISHDSKSGDDTWTSGGVQITNKTGAELPSTGGMGTTVLYIVGGVLVVGAVILLVVKRRKVVSE